MNCLKAVILLWTCIIAFHASVTAIVVDDYNISAISINSIGGLYKTVDVYFNRIRNKENQDEFDEIFKTPEAPYGPEQHIIGFFDKKMMLDMDMPNPSKKNAGLNRTLLELTEKLLQFNPSQKEMSTKLIEE
ncbi:uncharacterized protein LOC100572066 [Acyrthosiphon pisum]|uniref:Uncharacterized protein n=1 Tax=Acyrthosiphon pisum TaxID=7029 RepID=A0A8R1W4I7_ACYPI|nr:uncharacterized protein LOC100572066 [Acyrthosiphon pisum]|eukprot:XP_003242188.1 PREDICTED: uncharacterized protein LOC100572066 [Acyrthosiphon pisum]